MKRRRGRKAETITLGTSTAWLTLRSTATLPNDGSGTTIQRTGRFGSEYAP